VTNANPGGWRNIFWMQAAFHAATALGLFVFYRPKQGSDYGKLSVKQIVWQCDPVGSFFFITSTVLLLLALTWAGGTYSWSDAHVAAPLTAGLVLLAAFCIYGE
jgi:hypothetical protein